MKLRRRLDNGFTLVELLIVIVIIAILAAITIVAYNGIQSRAKNSASQQAASETARKAEIYNVDVGYYPLSLSSMTGAPSTASYSLTGVVNGGTLTNNTPTNGVTYYVCGTGSPASAAAITSSNVSGGIAYYRDYTNSKNTYTGVGQYSGAGIACYGTS